MSTPPSSRGSSLDHTFRPATPESTPTFRRSATSTSVPKSEYLRNALEARRAQNTPVQNGPKPAAINTQIQRPTVPAPSAPHTPAASPDVFDEFDLPEELMTPESPIRKRRPHEKDTPPRGKTNQELSTEVEKLKDELIKQNIRVELLKKSNHELQAKWLKAKEEADQLKPLEEDNFELRSENKKLTEKLNAVQDDIDHIDEMNDELDKLYLHKKGLEEANGALTEEVMNLANVNKEAITSMKHTEEALNEAVEMITSLEGERLHLKNEVNNLTGRVAAIESQQVDGSGPLQRIHSIDEHRPATSYDDSDYYSQPATPRADVDRDAKSICSTTSIRSKQFFELTRERTRSSRSLSKRMSDASLKATHLVFTGHIPEVSHIPEECEPVTPRVVDERFRERRYRQDADIEYVVARSSAEMHRPATVAPLQEPLVSHSVPRPVQVQEPSTSQSSSRHARSPKHLKSSQPGDSTQSAIEYSPTLPPRVSSRRAYTTSEDVPRPHFSEGSLGSDTASGTLVRWEEKEQTQEQVASAWASTNPRTSTVSLLTSPRIDGPDTDRWWKDTENVRPLRTRATTRTLRANLPSDADDLGSRTFAARAAGIRSSPATPAAERPEQDFLFNPRENEDQFMRKAITRLKGSLWR